MLSDGVECFSVAVVWQVARQWDCCKNSQAKRVHTANVTRLQGRISKTEVLLVG